MTLITVITNYSFTKLIALQFRVVFAQVHAFVLSLQPHFYMLQSLIRILTPFVTFLISAFVVSQFSHIEPPEI